MPTDLLKRRPLGKIAADVAAISIGCAPLGNMPDTFDYEVSAENAIATVRTALDSPLNYLDTAAHYGDGESERRVGLALREIGGLPEGAFLQTKEGQRPDGDYSGEMVKRRFHRSLELLGVDRIELVFLHDAENTSWEEAWATGGPVETLQSLKEEGLIGHLGVASGPVDLETRYVESGVFDAVITHNRYTLLNRAADPLLTLASDKGLAVLNAAPYGSGILAKGPAQYPRYAYQTAESGAVDQAFRFQDICDRYQVPLAAAALQFSLRDPRISNTIVGMTRPERIQQTIDFANWEIPDTCWEEILAEPFDSDDLVR
ncbi:MAG: aldo/keto reductase [Chloroflexia bacterium]|nr:aldo/keto reductase [Chloroflexia bacterium]